jgi:hypothetical protein
VSSAQLMTYRDNSTKRWRCLKNQDLKAYVEILLEYFFIELFSVLQNEMNNVGRLTKNTACQRSSNMSLFLRGTGFECIIE